MTPPSNKRGLGRGLSALLGPDSSTAPAAAASEGSMMQLALAKMQAGQYQPRTRMDEGALQELAASIRLHGIMQPIVVRQIAGDRYEIIAGERRFRAAAIAGLAEVPVIIKNVKDQDALALALIENIQREDLSALEEAQAIKRLLDEFSFTHEQAAEAIGRSRSATSNLLRLLNLAAPVQTMLMAGDLDMGHARALLSLPAVDQITCAHQIVQRQLTVRDAEKLVTKVATEGLSIPSLKPAAIPSEKSVNQSRDVERLAERLADALATKVQLSANAKGKGKLVIEFSDLQSFEDLLNKLGLQGVMQEG
jgi:ParB family transcriptional regulator, chromosome partitioning protein